MIAGDFAKLLLFVPFVLWGKNVLLAKRVARAESEKLFFRIAAIILYALLALSALYLFSVRDFGPPPVLYLFSLVLTLILECSVAFFLGYGTKGEIFAVVLCSLVTHPTLHLAALLPGLLLSDPSAGFSGGWTLAFESLIVVAECALLDLLLPSRRADNARLSLSMNVFSYFVGFLLSKGLILHLSR